MRTGEELRRPPVQIKDDVVELPDQQQGGGGDLRDRRQDQVRPAAPAHHRADPELRFGGGKQGRGCPGAGPEQPDGHLGSEWLGAHPRQHRAHALQQEIDVEDEFLAFCFFGCQQIE